MKKIKISALPEGDSLKGLYTIGTDANNESVKVSLEFVEDAADAANTAAKNANTAADRVDAAIETSDTATAAANEAAQAANDAADNANIAADVASTAAENAKSAASSATVAASVANNAANNANTAADAANTAADNATSAASSATSAASAANTAADNANDAADSATSAASSATSAASAANTAADSANSAASSATSAASAASTAAENADSAASSATSAASAANTAADNANDAADSATSAASSATSAASAANTAAEAANAAADAAAIDLTDIDADTLDGLHATSFVGRSDSYWTDGQTVEEWAKTIATHPYIYAPTYWSWAGSAYLTVGDYSLDCMRYAAISFRSGSLTNAWNQKAILFLPTYSESMIYLAQMYTQSTAGEVSLAVKRYADYDTIIKGNVASATKLATARKLWGQSFDGSADVSGDMTDVGNITASGLATLNGGVKTNQITLVNGDHTATISLDEDGNIHIDKGVYSDEFLSVGGSDDNS